MNAILKEFIKSLKTESISRYRKKLLKPLIDYIQIKIDKNALIRLNFICTHNSRRSHLAQVWAQVAAFYFKVDKVMCYSGGTEATAMSPSIGITLESQGLNVHRLSSDNNPVYAIKYAQNNHPIIVFSKTYDHPFNPSSEYAAIVTCSQADENCPFIPGAEKRLIITYEDPKAFDNTPQQSKIYKERSLQIATDMFYVFSQLSLQE